MSEIKPDYLLFDWDGTLVDSLPLIRDAHNHVRRYFGQPDWTDSEFRQNLHSSSRDLYPKVYGKDADKAINVLYAYINDNHMDTLSPMEGASELLDFLRKTKFKCGVISNKRHDYLQKEIDHLNVRDIFPVAIGASFAEKDKPYRSPFDAYKASSKYLTDQNNVWYIGDSVTDIQFAANSKITSVLIGSDKVHKEIKRTLMPNKHFLNCSDLKHFLENNT